MTPGDIDQEEIDGERRDRRNAWIVFAIVLLAAIIWSLT